VARRRLVDERAPSRPRSRRERKLDCRLNFCLFCCRTALGWWRDPRSSAIGFRICRDSRARLQWTPLNWASTEAAPAGEAVDVGRSPPAGRDWSARHREGVTGVSPRPMISSVQVERSLERHVPALGTGHLSVLLSTGRGEAARVEAGLAGLVLPPGKEEVAWIPTLEGGYGCSARRRAARGAVAGRMTRTICRACSLERRRVTLAVGEDGPALLSQGEG